MRYFFSTGETSGEFVATVLAQAIRRFDPGAEFEGIGAAEMRRAGFRVWRDHAGWATMGPFAALMNVPRLLAEGTATVAHIARVKPDLVVLVNFGAFNLRLAKVLRRVGYRGAILDLFPPGAWLDDPKRAKEAAGLTVPVTAFAHQRDFFAALRLPIAYFGHPIVAQYAMRGQRPPAPSDAGVVALLPGSRPAELRHHIGLLLDAYDCVRARRPKLRAIAGAANHHAAKTLHARTHGRANGSIAIVDGMEEAIRDADAAWVASGTAVLECALSGVPVVAFYVVSPLLARYVRRVHVRRFITLPNLVCEREIVPELLQERATPQALADAMERVLRAPQDQYAAFAALRNALGPPDALERCAAFAVSVAKAPRGGGCTPW